jgi:hypothetical protein
VSLSRRRSVRGLATNALVDKRKISVAQAVTSLAVEPEWVHGIALRGNLKYRAKFTQFGYVNAEARPAS